MKIGIDIDDTIAEFSEETDIWAKEYTEKILHREFTLSNIEIYDPKWAKYIYTWTTAESDEFWNLYYERIVEDAKPKENAVEVINELFKSNDIIIVSARWDKESGIIQELTKNWLKKYGINYNKLYLGHEDKRDIVRRNNIDLFIDDSIRTCMEIHEIGVKTYIMNSRINEILDVGDMERVFSWKEIMDKIS